MKTALITGANKGLGLEFVRQLKAEGYFIMGCCRNPAQASELNKIADEVVKLDVTKDDDIISLQKILNNRPIDLLINNAGISGEKGVTVGKVNRENFLEVLNVNCVSVVKLSDALLSNVKASTEKTILVISSKMGSISDNTSGRSFAYRASKSALNSAMRSFAVDVKELGVHVMLIHPGWVKTDMGGPDALIDAPTSVSGILKVRKNGKNQNAEQLVQFDGQIIEW